MARRFYSTSSSSAPRQHPLHLWLRAEQKPMEQRTLLHPTHVEQLLKSGIKVTVEASRQRCIKDSDYARIQHPLFSMAPELAWRKDPKVPQDAVIAGLKELDDGKDTTPLRHRHIYFAHCYKGQQGSEALLQRFKKGGGKLYDLEFLTDDRGVRVASFSNAAGRVGASLGLEAWARQQLQDGKVPSLSAQNTTYAKYEDLDAHVRPLIEQASAKNGRKPTLFVIGALGRSGKGAVASGEAVGVNITQWDMKETSKGGPFKELLAADVFVNCIYLNPKGPKSAPFLTPEMISNNNNNSNNDNTSSDNSRQLSVLVDVSCDSTNPNTPLPIYNETTEFGRPTLVLVPGTGNQRPFEVIAIDHLPSLVPYSSSKDFADQMIGHLLAFDSTPVWQRAVDLFEEKLAQNTN
eukprot:TRINITY_DN848_c0_g1_i1.p1 TRINITY_DN848_c0_g1~~TRINITY_DN848_c0_g1_i1.p1  ORF type:complete len:406 (-),score=87.47 TRINITY_DN848_c0_g1_i1:221-1438(-)